MQYKMGQRQEQVIQRGNVNDLQIYEKIPSLIREIQIKTKMRRYFKNLKI